MDATVNSRRMQHAHMMNGIEDKRMRNYLRGLEKERRQVLRTTSQDIRMVGLTMDFIQASSGYSPEGLPSSSDDEEEEDEVPEVIQDPYFHVDPRTMVVFDPRRARSAPGMARPKRHETRSATLVEQPQDENRVPRNTRVPQATPLYPPQGAVRRVAAPTLLSAPVTPRRPFSGANFHQEDVRKLIHRPQSRDSPSPTVPTQAWGPREVTERNMDSPEPRQVVSRGPAGSRAHQISRAVQQVRALTATAKRMQNMTPSQALLMTNTLTSKQQETRDRLQVINDQEQRRIQEKLKYFYAKYPIGLPNSRTPTVVK